MVWLVLLSCGDWPFKAVVVMRTKGWRRVRKRADSIEPAPSSSISVHDGRTGHPLHHPHRSLQLTVWRLGETYHRDSQRFRSAIAKIRTRRTVMRKLKLTLTLALNLTLTDTGGAVQTLMLGYRSLYNIHYMAIAAICDSGLSPSQHGY